MKSKNGNFVYEGKDVIYLPSYGVCVWGDLNVVIEAKYGETVVLSPSELRELADFIEELQKQKD